MWNTRRSRGVREDTNGGWHERSCRRDDARDGGLCLLKTSSDTVMLLWCLRNAGARMAWRWLRAIRRRVREHVNFAVECAALRHQVAILQRSRSRHPRFGPWDRLLWAFLSQYWPRWREALVLVQAETVLRWDRQRGGRMRLLPRFRRRRRGGRPRIDAEIRDLISHMARDNVLWGAPRIHGELLMLGFNVSQATVSRYIRRWVRPRSPGWRSFLRT